MSCIRSWIGLGVGLGFLVFINIVEKRYLKPSFSISSKSLHWHIPSNPLEVRISLWISDLNILLLMVFNDQYWKWLCHTIPSLFFPLPYCSIYKDLFVCRLGLLSYLPGLHPSKWSTMSRWKSPFGWGRSYIFIGWLSQYPFLFSN